MNQHQKLSYNGIFLIIIKGIIFSSLISLTVFSALQPITRFLLGNNIKGTTLPHLYAPIILRDKIQKNDLTKIPDIDIESLKRYDLFGEKIDVDNAEAEKTSKIIEQESLKPSKLNLKLAGSIISPDKKMSFAIIENQKRQETYRLNEEIDGFIDVKVVDIFHDKVILNNRGKTETLTMLFKDKRTSPKAAISEKPTAPLPPTSSENLPKIDNIVRLGLQNHAGKITGFLVGSGSNREAFSNSEFKAADIITAIDGTSINSIRVAQQAWQQTKEKTQAVFTVQRDNNEIEITIDTQNL